MVTPANIDEYISGFAPETQKMLRQLRQTIKNAAPGAKEVISYGMPAFEMNGVLVWFGAFKAHIGFYPRGSGIEKFEKELSIYKGTKGAVQFPLDKPLPIGLITEIVKFRVKENMQKPITTKK